MSFLLFGMVIALQLVQLLMRIQEVRKMRTLVDELHNRGEHDAATLTRIVLLPGDLPTAEQIGQMRRDGWPKPQPDNARIQG